MLNGIALCVGVAIVLGIGSAASAAARHYRISHVAPAYYNVVPDGLGGGCSPVHPPLCSYICPTDGSPCHVNPDY